MSAPMLTNGHWYRVLTHAGRVWQKVQYDAGRQVFVCKNNPYRGPQEIAHADVVRISPRRSDKERSGGVPFTDATEWRVAA